MDDRIKKTLDEAKVAIATAAVQGIISSNQGGRNAWRKRFNVNRALRDLERLQEGLELMDEQGSNLLDLIKAHQTNSVGSATAAGYDN